MEYFATIIDISTTVKFIWENIMKILLIDDKDTWYADVKVNYYVIVHC